MKITSQLFEKSFFYIAPGYDIQPFLRFNHISRDFIYVNLFLQQELVEEWYDRAFESSSDLEVINKTVVRYFDETRHFELHRDYRKHLRNPDFLTDGEKEEYLRIFTQAIPDSQYALVYELRRKSLDRVFTLYFITGEGLASYIALSQNGIYAPRVLCTIQSGVLERPESMLSRIFENTDRKRPLLWIRGFEPDADPKSRDNVLANEGIYNYPVIDFNGKWTCGYSFDQQHQDLRHCKGFTHAEYYSTLQAMELKEEFQSEEVSVYFGRLEDNAFHIYEKDVIVTTHTARLPELNAGQILHWEDLSKRERTARQQVMDLNEKLRSMDLAVDTRIHVLPFCREDEGIALYGALSDIPFSSVIYCARPFDMLDLKEGSPWTSTLSEVMVQKIVSRYNRLKNNRISRQESAID